MAKFQDLSFSFNIRTFSIVGLFLTIFHFSNVVGQDVMGCGGFVRTSKTIDVTRIQMSLFNKKNGNLRKAGSTDCAPINGYYFIPVYENGDYILKAIAPRGWKVEPSEMLLSIDGKTDSCSKNVDLNFEFIGFGITGSVLSQGSTTGPGGLDIELLNPDGKSVLQTSTTNDEGHFDFFGVSPGSYIARIAKKHAKSFAFDSEQRTVEVGEDVGVCQPFLISGYELSGEVQYPSGQPLSDVLITIRRDGTTDAPIKIRSDKSGKFSARLPNGNYKIRADHDDKSVKLVKQQLEAAILHQNSKLDPFVVESFSVKGKVRTHASKGKPFSGVKVSVSHDGKTEELITNADGSFSVENVRNAPISAKVTAEGFDFDVASLNRVDPGLGFPVIAPARYLLTGKVERDSLSVDTEVRIKFFSSSDVQQPHNGRVLATDRGTYSIYLPAGSYSVAVELSVEQTNIGFAPLKHDIVIVDAPVRDINFQPVRANLEGRVACLASECSPIQVTLVAEGAGVASAQKTLTGAKGQFSFEGVLPGTYTMSLSDGDRRCWSEVVKKISVSADVKDILFKQTGYNVQVNSVRSAILVLSDENGNPVEEVVIGKGENSVCLKSQKAIRFSTKGCEVFEIEPERIEDPSSLETDFRVTLKPTKYQVSGRIASKSPIPDLKLLANSEIRKVDVETKKISTGYSFSFYAFPGEDLSFHPKSEEHLFDPESLHVYVDNDCHLESVHFEANTGFFLRGKVSPPVEGVKIDLVDMKTRTSRQTVFTNEQGTYKVGPLPADSTYDVLAEKEGYIFEAVASNQGHFNAKKLASIVVKVVDEATGAVLPGVVVSISGGVDYRSNTVTKSGGEANFLSLAPGRYFAKPQIKEYEFEPKNELLELVEGQTGKVTFRGKRVAFSIFGKISSLNGEPESGVVLKAKGVAPQVCVGHSEEATSEAGGEFRFRGLQPNCEYVLRLQSDKQNIEKLMPDETKVLVGQNDTFLSSPLIAMRSFEFTDATLKVLDEVSEKGKPPLVKISVTSDTGFTFNFQALVGQLVTLPRLLKDEKRYTVTVETISSEKFHSHKRATSHFRADEYYKYLEITISKQAQTTSKTARKISSFVYFLPLVIAALVSYIFWDKMPPAVQTTVEKLIGANSSGSAASASAVSGNDEVWDGTMAKKRPNKKRA